MSDNYRISLVILFSFIISTALGVEWFARDPFRYLYPKTFTSTVRKKLINFIKLV